MRKLHLAEYASLRTLNNNRYDQEQFLFLSNCAFVASEADHDSEPSRSISDYRKSVEATKRNLEVQQESLRRLRMRDM